MTVDAVVSRLFSWCRWMTQRPRASASPLGDRIQVVTNDAPPSEHDRLETSADATIRLLSERDETHRPMLRLGSCQLERETLPAAPNAAVAEHERGYMEDVRHVPCVLNNPLRRGWSSLGHARSATIAAM